ETASLPARILHIEAKAQQAPVPSVNNVSKQPTLRSVPQEKAAEIQSSSRSSFISEKQSNLFWAFGAGFFLALGLTLLGWGLWALQRRKRFSTHGPMG